MTSDESSITRSVIGSIDSERIVALFGVIENLDGLDPRALPEPWLVIEDLQVAILELNSGIAAAITMYDGNKPFFFGPKSDEGFTGAIENCTLNYVGRGIVILRIFACGIMMPGGDPTPALVTLASHMGQDLAPFIGKDWTPKGVE